MAFSFNFDVLIETEGFPEDDIQQDRTTDNPTKSETDDCTTKKIKEAKEHYPPLDRQPLLENAVTETLTIGTLPPLHYLNESVFERTAPERDDLEKILSRTVAQHSDLISGVYEGGLKIWECTYDLLEYVENEGVTFSGKRVLDLGCGAGLLGILGLKRGAAKVDFQDYNSTVIEQLTVPNVLLNCDEDDCKTEGRDSSPSPKRKAMDPSRHSDLSSCSFYSGDWTSFLTLMLSKDSPLKYDIIFTSETIYNTLYYPALHDVFHKLLAEGGLVYVATKSHYFGVGGGLHLFQTFVRQKDIFQMKCLMDVEQGLQRHVVTLTFRKTKPQI